MGLPWSNLWPKWAGYGLSGHATAYFKVKLANVVNFQIDFTIVAYFKTSF